MYTTIKIGKIIIKYFLPYIMSPLQIVDKLLPLTREDQRCGFQKAKKLRARAQIIVMINDYLSGVNVTLPEEVIKLLKT